MVARVSEGIICGCRTEQRVVTRTGSRRTIVSHRRLGPPRNDCTTTVQTAERRRIERPFDASQHCFQQGFPQKLWMLTGAVEDSCRMGALMIRIRQDGFGQERMTATAGERRVRES
jgi:hypothetical protein